jgi:hypothetical protein
MLLGFGTKSKYKHSSKDLRTGYRSRYIIRTWNLGKKGKSMEKRDRKEHEKHKRDEYEGKREQPHGTGYGREQVVYLEHMARRWDGSQPPSAQAYSRALQQLRQLPGSVVTTATDLGTIRSAAPPLHPDHSRKHRKNREES